VLILTVCSGDPQFNQLISLQALLPGTPFCQLDLLTVDVGRIDDAIIERQINLLYLCFFIVHAKFP